MLSHTPFLYDIEGKEVPENVKDAIVSVKIIPPKAFKNQHSLKNVVLLEGVQIIERGAFEGCSALITFKFPERGFERIKGDAFYFCDSLKNIKFPNGLQEIGESAFHSCESLIAVDIPNSVQKIAEYAFRDCISLAFVKVSTSIKVIPDFGFFGCRNLKTVIIPDELQEIGDFAFQSCSSLTVVELPRNMRKIGNNCFKGCEKLLEKSLIKFDGDIKRLIQNRFHGLPMHQLLYRYHYKNLSGEDKNLQILKELYNEDKAIFRRKDMFGLSAIDIFYTSSNKKHKNSRISITSTISTANTIEQVIDRIHKYELDRECELEKERKIKLDQESEKKREPEKERKICIKAELERRCHIEKEYSIKEEKALVLKRDIEIELRIKQEKELERERQLEAKRKIKLEEELAKEHGLKKYCKFKREEEISQKYEIERESKINGKKLLEKEEEIEIEHELQRERKLVREYVEQERALARERRIKKENQEKIRKKIALERQLEKERQFKREKQFKQEQAHEKERQRQKIQQKYKKIHYNTGSTGGIKDEIFGKKRDVGKLFSFTKVGNNLFYDFDETRKIAAAAADEEIEILTEYRFQNLPVHELIYHRHSMESTKEVLERLEVLFNENKDDFRTKDMFGMTALNILSATSSSKKKISDSGITKWFVEKDHPGLFGKNLFLKEPVIQKRQ